MNLDLHKERVELLGVLETLSPEAQYDRMFAAVTDTGGNWIGPNSTGRTKATHQVEIDLLGLHATGSNDEEAIHNWIGIVRRQVAEQALAS
ncbi:MAG: hypothetical protein COA53_06550 [Rhodobacteraceae bacterium]|nr:MAG: hypothetical protein COA53_06550 [Paracoccaceae bacterium]